MSTQPKHLLTPEEYLEIERTQASSPDKVIAETIGSLLRQQLPQDCVYVGDMRLVIGPERLPTYPDVVVVTEQKLLGENDILLNPTVIIEVMTPWSEAFDRGHRFHKYAAFASLAEYLVVASDRI